MKTEFHDETTTSDITNSYFDTMLKKWEIARGIIENENEIINHRINWFLTLQGILFVAFTYGITGQIEETEIYSKTLIFITTIIICIVGAFSPWFIIPSLHSGIRQMLATHIWWTHLSSRHDQEVQFPPLLGISIYNDYPESYRPYKQDINKVDKIGLISMPYGMSIIWFIILIGLSIYGIYVF
jgi:hypothetical protein